MNRKHALPTLLLTIATSICAHAQDVRNDPGNDGKTAEFVKDGAMVEIYNKDEGLQDDGGPWILIKTDEYTGGTGGVYRIKSSTQDVYLSLDEGKLNMSSPVISVSPNGRSTKDHSKIATWVLHLNSRGWSIMSSANRALAISRTEEPMTNPFIAKTNLQRNQGRPHQIWMIKQIGFAVNPEMPSQPQPTAPAAQSGFPEGYFYMATKDGEGDYVLESDPLELRKRGNYTGMLWKAIPAGDGYFFLTTKHLEEQGLVLEGGSPGESGELGGGAVMTPNKATGTIWKAIKADGGYYLHNKYLGKEQFLMTKSEEGSVPYMADSTTGGGKSEWQFNPTN